VAWWLKYGVVFMIKVFLSSTFRDLQDKRKELLEKLNASLDGIGMEKFIPDGRTSQEVAIDELKKSDIAIFLVSPYYGSFIEKCDLKDCKCGIKNGSGEKISYTHCEYKIALSENKPHQVYLVDKDWDVIKKLKDWDRIDWKHIRTDEDFKELKDDEIEHYFKVAKEVWKFKEETGRELSPRDRDNETIVEGLAKNIIKWHSDGKIELQNFCGRKKELRDLFEKINETVEVYGVGGVGKTTLIHIALLMQKLRGKDVISIGTRQSYVTGSGYEYFREKCKEGQREIIGEKIRLMTLWMFYPFLMK
jgi:hypothetical protein